MYRRQNDHDNTLDLYLAILFMTAVGGSLLPRVLFESNHPQRKGHAVSKEARSEAQQRGRAVPCMHDLVSKVGHRLRQNREGCVQLLIVSSRHCDG